MESTPKWFLRELRIIDPTYYVKVNEAARTYDVMKDAEIYLKFRDGTVYKRKEPRVVGSYPLANERALTSLRYRKWLGRQMRIIEKPGAEREAMRKEEEARMAKHKEEGFDMMTYGFKEAYAVDRKHSVS
jgi:hypothetical protein